MDRIEHRIWRPDSKATLNGILAGLVLLGLLAPSTGHSELPESIERVLAGLGVDSADVSILVRRLDSPEPMLSHLPEVARNPASVMKLVTTWSGLELLGPAYTWPTEVYFDGGFDGRRLYGDLAIKGHGDPFLVIEEFWKLLRAVRRLGLHEIEGDLLLDDSFFDIPPEDPGAFDGQPYRTYNVVPNALLVNFKAVRFFFLADPRQRRVLVSSDPELPNLSIRNRIDLVDGPCRGYQAGISFNVDDPADMSRIIFEGDFPARCNNYSLSRTVLEHDTYVYGIFRSLWGELGGSLEGGFRKGPIPESASRVVTWESPPLAEVIRSINKNSNNVMTRQLLLTIGAEHVGTPGTEMNGIAVIDEFLTAEGVHDGSLQIVNGAGLSRESRVSARMLVDMLEAAARGAYAPEFLASLSIAGVDGTTRNRFDANSGNGVMHVKSGRLDHVSALAGYAHGDDDAIYALAVMMNATDAHRGLGQELEEAVMRWLHAQI
ncbi:MAG TPA: D-alanyl-D-alanine carboxypeptidase/D-alanyl-D-alanine-endopeptidase [Gammaproteobacteria bacterium]|jgi:D-alanyl-D-alanine carboxypeptidase/D-alanyl-D-alanine-endopeptidase (penicillin-binding protein 4)